MAKTAACLDRQQELFFCTGVPFHSELDLTIHDSFCRAVWPLQEASTPPADRHAAQENESERVSQYHDAPSLRSFPPSHSKEKRRHRLERLHLARMTCIVLDSLFLVQVLGSLAPLRSLAQVGRPFSAGEAGYHLQIICWNEKKIPSSVTVLAACSCLLPQKALFLGRLVAYCGVPII